MPLNECTFRSRGEARQPDLIRRLLERAVAPGGRLIVGTCNEKRFPGQAHEASTAHLIQYWGWDIAGKSEIQKQCEHRIHRTKGPAAISRGSVVRCVVWVSRCLNYADHSATKPTPTSFFDFTHEALISGDKSTITLRGECEIEAVIGWQAELDAAVSLVGKNVMGRSGRCLEAR